MSFGELYRIKTNQADFEKVIRTCREAFREYPKLLGSFPEESDRLAALEATLRYYCAFDLRFGQGYSLDSDMNEVILFLHSSDVRYTFFRHLRAGSFRKGYRAAMRQLPGAGRKIRKDLFEELELLEKTVVIPTPHIYVDFLGVRPEYQHGGRGRKLMRAVCEYAASIDCPVMLFTNTPEDVLFYHTMGFQTIGTVRSEKYRFSSTYLLKP